MATQHTQPAPALRRSRARIDVVVVSFNSRTRLRGCVETLSALEDVHVVVVDNASSDESLEAVADLPVTTIALDANTGFSSGCNVGWSAGQAPFVLFLNPDARLDEASLRCLVGVLEGSEQVGAVGPKILGHEGSLDLSRRRFPRIRSTYAQAVFLHRLFPLAEWSDEVIHDVASYAYPSRADWLSGACLLIRRSVLEQLGGLNEEYFLYREDTELCLDVWQAGYEVRYEPEAVATHEGGASSPRTDVFPILAASRILYAQKHWTRLEAFIERIGIALGALTHIIVCHGGRQVRYGHVRALKVAALPGQMRKYIRTSGRAHSLRPRLNGGIAEPPDRETSSAPGEQLASAASPSSPPS